MKRFIMLGGAIFAAATASASAYGTDLASEPMLRLWRGYKQVDATSETVRDRMNQSLIPETIAIGAGHGLLAYLPALYDPQYKHEILPDEIALVTYESEAAYNAIRATPRGQAYGPLHFQPGLFARELPDGRKSSSAVAEPYLGVLKPGGAYVLSSTPAGWQRGQVVFRTLMRSGTPDPKSHLDRLMESQKRIGIQAAIVLVEKDYLIEVLQFIDVRAAKNGLKALSSIRASGYALFQVIAAEPRSARTARLDFGRGLNVRFPTYFPAH